MGVGLQVFDASGNIILDATYRVSRFIGSVPISSNSPSGTITDARLAQGGFVSFQPSITCGDGFLSGGIICPNFSVSGSTVSWSYPPANNPSLDIYQSGTLFYGAS